MSSDDMRRLAENGHLSPGDMGLDREAAMRALGPPPEVAVPLTQEQARKVLRDNMWYAEADWHPESGRDLHVDLLAAVLSASPEVLAAAMGGEYIADDVEVGASYIMLPRREVSRGDR